MKCNECGSTKFVLREVNRIWTEEFIDTITKEISFREHERELMDGSGWDGFFCAKCDAGVDAEDDENYERSEELYSLLETWKAEAK